MMHVTYFLQCMQEETDMIKFIIDIMQFDSLLYVIWTKYFLDDKMDKNFQSDPPVFNWFEVRGLSWPLLLFKQKINSMCVFIMVVYLSVCVSTFSFFSPCLVVDYVNLIKLEKIH